MEAFILFVLKQCRQTWSTFEIICNRRERSELSNQSPDKEIGGQIE